MNANPVLIQQVHILMITPPALHRFMAEHQHINKWLPVYGYAKW